MDKTTSNNKTISFLRRNGWNIFWAALLLVLVISPNAKALVLRGLMKVGFFRPSVPAQTTNATNNPVATDAIFKTVQGETVHLSSLKGKVVFLNFWATWCPPCIAEMPGINELYLKLSSNKNIVFIMADADANAPVSGNFMKTHQYSLPLYLLVSPGGKDLFTGTLPATVILNKQGEIVFQKSGAGNYDTGEFLQWLQQLANE